MCVAAAFAAVSTADGQSYQQASGIALTLIAFSLVWPQGQGDRSWGPFGRTPVQQTPEMKARIKREKDAAIRREEAAKKAVEAASQMPNQVPQ